MAFPNFHGKKGENARNFLDDLEMAFLVSRRDSAKIKLRAFPLVLREKAKRFHDDNNPEEIWRKLSQLQQASPYAYPAYEARFLKLWTQWEQILPEGERAPNFLQKERFLAGLALVLREKVKCKFPDLFEVALTWARLKDRKIQFQRSMLDQSQAAAAGTTSQEQAPPSPPNESGDPHLDLLQRAIITNGPFEKWGIDAMGPLPRTANGKLYVLVAIDYMTRFGTPLEIVSDNGPGFRRGLLTEVCEELKISHRHSTPYYPQSNGLVEKANGIIARIIRKMVESKPKR
ncbi:hypothetical protein L7F22_044723 [Adiantum nelumboides]|nr:hypothetical protein [Adiantum nelumboides]